MDLPIVLFLCTGNSARSQMAEALLNRHGGDRFTARSAGLQPRAIHPLTIRVMQEIGLDLNDHRSKGVAEFLGRAAVRFAVVVCSLAEQSCPKSWPFGTQVLAWPFADPALEAESAQAQLDQFRTVRDQIEAKILDWLEHH